MLTNQTQTLKASKALLSHIQKTAVEKSSKAATKNLLDDDEDADSTGETPVWLTLTTKRHISDKSRLQPGKIPLPHPLVPLDDEHSTHLPDYRRPAASLQDPCRERGFP